MVKNVAKSIYDAVGAEALVTSCSDLRFYLTGFQTTAGHVITDVTGTTLYTDMRYLEAAREALAGTGIAVKYDDGKKLTELLDGYKTLGVPFSRLTAREYLSLSAAGFKLIDSSSSFKKEMSVKGAEEIENIKSACAATDRAFDQLLPEIREDMTEREVANELEYLMKKNGAYCVSFETICAFGANASVPHHMTGDTQLKFGDAILIDFGCKINGYCSDCTRTFLYGDDKKHGDFKEMYSRVLEANKLFIEDFHSGMKGKEGDAIARNYLKKFGLDKYFIHSLGHSLGINIHESPNLSAVDENVFADGMVFSDEPGVYIAGELGIRVEDTVTLSNGNVLTLTNSNKNLIIL